MSKRGTLQERQPLIGASRFSLSLPSGAEYVALARLFAASIVRHFGCAEELVEDVKLAISEACTNAIKAHWEARTDEPVVINVVSDGASLSFEVVDSGGGFDVPTVRPGTVTPPGGLYEGSLGLTLIRTLFPGAEIARNTGRGMTVRFALEVSGEPDEEGT